MSTETRSSAEIRADVERVSRTLQQKQSLLAMLLKSTRGDDGAYQMMPHQVEQVRSLESECCKLTDQVNNFKLHYMQVRTEEDLEKSTNEPLDQPRLFPAGESLDGNGRLVEVKTSRLPASLGDAFVDSPTYKAWRHGSQGQNAFAEVGTRHGVQDYVHAAIKAALTTSGLTSFERPPGTITLGQQMLTVADLFANGRTSSPVIRYLREVSLTNSAATVAEGDPKPEQEWVLEEVDATVRKIAVYTKVTDELFADYEQVRTYINDRLPFLIRQREEFQLLSGTGIAPNILGVLAVTGILTQARGADSNVDAIYKGITKVRTEGFFEPDAVVIDPSNWTTIRLMKTTTGEYVWGPPSMQGPETIFGKRVVPTVNMTDNVALVGAFMVGGTVFYREGLRVEATNSNEDDFKTNKIMLRAEQRESLAIWRAKAFCTVTGLN